MRLGILIFISHIFCSTAFGGELILSELISDALKNNPEILAAEARSAASGFKVPQAGSLPDPMVMFGYQNEGWKKYTYGEMPDAQWMFTASQMFPYPGKLGLKSEMARQDADSRKAMTDAVRLQVVAKIKSLYYDLFLAYKNIDLIRDRTILFDRIEDAAVARYASGMGMQQEILMAQTEKYMLLEKEEMQKQKIQSAEAMLNSTVGRDINAPLGRPAEFSAAVSLSLEGFLGVAFQNSPEVRSKEKMIAAAEAKVSMAKREYYPDFTINAGYANRGGGQFEDMWSLTTTINIPLFYRTKQRQAVAEAEAELLAARYELEATRFMIASGLRDNYSMYKSAERLTELYNSGLMPKAYQDFESAIGGYSSGKIEAITVINRLKTIIDLDIAYWGQRVEMEKALARCEAIAGLRSEDPEVRSQGVK
ncbi:MAG: TolC family protein [Nitrospirae bacterium]|nr:TolC family protein [Nitrospirota bacterium]